MVSPPELAVLILAAYRGTQLAVHDTILDVPRSWLYDWHSRKATSPVRAAAVTLISCVYCMGFWVSGTVLAAFLLWPDSFAVRIGLLWFAVAGGQALFNRWDDSRKDTSA